MRGVIYDATRLVARRNAALPTGIDRVDLRYAQRALEGAWGDAMLVTQLGGRFVEMPRVAAQRLMSALHERWTEGRPTPTPDALLRDAGLVDAPPSAEEIEARAKAVRTFAIGHPGCIYMNSSHHGLGNKELFASLDSVLGGGFVFFVHDLIPIELPEYVRPGDDLEHEKRLHTILSLGACVIVNSEATRAAVAAWARSHGYEAPRMVVARIGVEASFANRAPAPPAPSGRPTFVCVGTIEPRKNHITLLHVWRDFATRLPQQQVPRLVLIGRRGWECGHVFAMLDRCRTIAPHVVEQDSLNDASLVETMLGATALLFPSFAEGWGMPLVEAMALGVPAICSDIPVFHEASQGLADFVAPMDAAAWSARILSYAAEDAEARAARRARLADFRAPTWTDHFRAVDSAMAELAQTRSGIRIAARAHRQAASVRLQDVADDALGRLIVARFDCFEDAVLAGDRARDCGMWKEAAAAYRAALEHQPDAAGILVQLGHMLKEAGQLRAAYEAYCRALPHMPEDPDLHLQIGHLFKVGGLIAEACAYYETAASLDPSNDDAIKHRDWARERLVAS